MSSPAPESHTTAQNDRDTGRWTGLGLRRLHHANRPDAEPRIVVDHFPLVGDLDTVLLADHRLAEPEADWLMLRPRPCRRPYGV